jgi:hypothetical protein
MAKTVATLKGKDAIQIDAKSTFQFEVKLTRSYIWIIKLKMIWSIIKAKVGE